MKDELVLLQKHFRRGFCGLAASCAAFTVFKNLKEGIVVFFFLSPRNVSAPDCVILKIQKVR